MAISTTAAQIAAQSYVPNSGTAAQAQRPQPAPRRIETTDLVDLTSRPQQPIKPPAPKLAAPMREAQSFSIPAGMGSVARESTIARGVTRPARPGSQLDIKV